MVDLRAVRAGGRKVELLAVRADGRKVELLAICAGGSKVGLVPLTLEVLVVKWPSFPFETLPAKLLGCCHARSKTSLSSVSGHSQTNRMQAISSEMQYTLHHWQNDVRPLLITSYCWSKCSQRFASPHIKAEVILLFRHSAWKTTCKVEPLVKQLVCHSPKTVSVTGGNRCQVSPQP